MNIFQQSRSKAVTYIATGKAGVEQKYIYIYIYRSKHTGVQHMYVCMYSSKAGVNEE